MKNLFVVLFSGLLYVAGVSAQEVQSVVEVPDSAVVLTSAQDDVTPAVPVPDVATVVEGQPLPPHAGENVVTGSGCGCGSPVVAFAAPVASFGSSACGCNNHYAPANDCCGYSRGNRLSARPQIIRGFRGRLASAGRSNGCCY